MQIQEKITAQHETLCRLIADRQLKEAFDSLGLWIKELQHWQAAEKKEELENTYREMLRYAVEGIADPQREEIYEQLAAAVLRLADELKESLLTHHAASYEYARMKDFRANALSTEELVMQLEEQEANLSLAALLAESLNSPADKSQENAKQREHSQIRLFDRWWLSSSYSKNEREAFVHLLTNENLFFQDKCLAVSALTLSLVRSFGDDKLQLLFDASLLPDIELSQRALVGLMLGLYLHDRRVGSHHALAEQLSQLAENNDFRRRIMEAIIQFIRTRETEAITQKIRSEIIPEMSKLSPFLMRKIDLEEVDSLDDFEERNPEWQGLIENSGVADKLREMSEMQQEGSDVFMSTFASLKDFPFFYDTANWFLPFDRQHSAIRTLFSDDQSLLSHFAQSHLMCNSDKFSFCLSVITMPKAQRKKLTKTMNLEAAEAEKIDDEEVLLQHRSSTNTIAKQYIQDLYRFYNLHPRRTDFNNPFARPLNFQDSQFFARLHFTTEERKEIADFYFLKNQYAEALSIYGKLAGHDLTNRELHQKIGFCRQQLGNFNGALKAYLQAETLQTNDTWTSKKIAFCYKALNQYDKALEYYQRLDAEKPDNVGTLLNIGHCLLNLYRYDEALSIYFKAEYLAPENRNARRAIAWCSFLVGKREQAQRYYTKLLADSPVPNDYLNAGHVAWTQGDRTTALRYYWESINADNGRLTAFLEAFEQDKNILIQENVSPQEIPLILDLLKYNLKTI